MPSRIRIGPEGGPYVILDENNGVLDIEAPDDTVNWQNNEFLNAVLGGALNAAGNQIQNPVLQGASLADALNANENDISGVGAFDSESVNTESLNNVVYQTESKGIVEATSEAGEAGTVVITADEQVDGGDWSDAIEDHMTFYGTDAIIEHDGSLTHEADHTTWIGCNIHADGSPVGPLRRGNFNKAIGGTWVQTDGGSGFNHIRIGGDNCSLLNVTCDDRHLIESTDNAIRIEDGADGVLIDGCTIAEGIRDDGADNVELGTNLFVDHDDIRDTYRTL